MITDAQAPARSFWVWPFAATLAAMFALQLSNLGFAPLLPSIQDEFAMSYTQLGLFTGMYGLLAMVLSVPAGVAAKRVGERSVLTAGLLGVAAGSVLLGEAWSAASAIVFRGLTIVGYRFAFVSVLIAVAVTAPPSLRGRTMGVLGATSALASVVGAPLGGLLVGATGWREAILGYAAMAVLGTTIFWLFYASPPEAPRTSDDGEPLDSASRCSAFRSRAVWMLALIVGMGGFGQFTVTNFAPSVARSEYGLNAAAAGVLISTGYMAAIVLNLLVGLLADRTNKLAVLCGVFAILAVASASMAADDLTTFRVATALVIGLGFTATNQIYGLAASVIPPREAGHAMGIVSLGAGLFGFFGPQMLGILRDVTGSFDAGFYMVATADVVTLLLMALLFKMARR